MITNEYGVEKRQRELLEMIKQLDDELRRMQIKYSLADGTLLGAIRHNGFIPWDDDIDIIVSRAEYEKLVKNADRLENFVLRRYLWTPRIQRLEDRDQRGILIPTIDIFIGDAVPASPVVHKLKVILLKMLQGMMKEEPEYAGHSAVYKVCIFLTHALGKLFSQQQMYRAYDRISRIGSKNSSDDVCFYNGTFKYVGTRYRKATFESYEYHAFEDCELPVTGDYDHFLTVSYGDYMTPPKESERKSIHVQQTSAD